MTRNVLVAGATGTQGGAVVDHLLSGEYGEFEVYAMTRNPESAGASALAERGTHVVEGDLTDRETLVPLVEEVECVYCVTTFFEAGTDTEVEQGTNMAEAAAEAGVEQFVFSSVGGADRDTGLAHFESKHRIERRIEELGLPATIVRPVYFMQNFEGQREEIEGGTLAQPLAEGVSLEMVDADDIGRAVARAFSNPDEFVGETVELAGDDRTLEEMAAAFGEALDRDVEAVHVPLDAFREEMGDEFADMYAWFNEVGYDTDIPRIESMYGVRPRPLPTYLDAHGWTG